MSAVALISDLMMQSQVTAAAARAGVEIAIVATDDNLVAQVETARPRLVIVDLSHPGLDAAALFARLHPHLGPDAMSVAFGPHVHKQRLAAAAKAGFASVISRGQFHAEMEGLLKRYAA